MVITNSIMHEITMVAPSPPKLLSVVVLSINFNCKPLIVFPWDKLYYYRKFIPLITSIVHFHYNHRQLTSKLHHHY